MLKPMIKNGEKKMNPCKDESILKKIANMIKKWALSALGTLKKVGKKAKKVAMITAAAGALAASLVSCSSEPAIPNHIDPTPIPGPVQPDDPTPVTQYAGYKLTVSNLTEAEKNDILSVLQSEYNNYANSGNYIENEVEKYYVRTEAFTDNDYDYLVNDVVTRCSDDASFALERSLYKLTSSSSITLEQMKNVLSGIEVRNAHITIEKHQDDPLTFAIVIDNLLDWNEKENVLNFFSDDIGITLGGSVRWETSRYADASKETLQSYHFAGEEDVVVEYQIKGGYSSPSHDNNKIEVVFEDVLFNNSSIDVYKNYGGNPIQPPQQELGGY